MRGLYEVVPYVLPSPQIQVRWEIRRAWEYEEPSKLWKDHIDSVNQFQAWKANHPRDGTMTQLYHFSSYIMVGLGLVIGIPTGNVLMIAGTYPAFCKIVDRWSGKNDS